MASPDQLDMEFFPKVLSKSEAAALRKRVEEQQNALQQSSQDLAALMNNIPGGVMCCDASNRLALLQYSDGFLSMFGYTRRELRSDLITSLFR